MSMDTKLFDADHAREYLYLVAERAAIALAHHVGDDEEGGDGFALRDLRTALNAYARTHRMRL